MRMLAARAGRPAKQRTTLYEDLGPVEVTESPRKLHIPVVAE